MATRCHGDPGQRRPRHPDGQRGRRHQLRPDHGYIGPDSFTYKANDGALDSNTVTVSLTVTATNAAPVAVADSYSTPKNTTLTVAAPGVLANDTDADGDTLTDPRGERRPRHSPRAPRVDQLRPNHGYFGTDSSPTRPTTGPRFRTPSRPLTVTPQRRPVAGRRHPHPKNTTLTVAPRPSSTNDTDVDGDTLSAIKVTNPTHGTVTVTANGSISYVPTAGYVGTDSFTYKANDGALGSNTVTVQPDGHCDQCRTCRGRRLVLGPKRTHPDRGCPRRRRQRHRRRRRQP